MDEISGNFNLNHGSLTASMGAAASRTAWVPGSKTAIH
jgi:hypothetical protein